MRDASREETIGWCLTNKLNMMEPKFPPPAGWMWYSGPLDSVALTAIFTNTSDADILKVDVMSADRLTLN